MLNKYEMVALKNQFIFFVSIHHFLEINLYFHLCYKVCYGMGAWYSFYLMEWKGT